MFLLFLLYALSKLIYVLCLKIYTEPQMQSEEKILLEVYSKFFFFFFFQWFQPSICAWQKHDVVVSYSV